ncbi:Uncharacterised protein [BD1-7 clade bacterium]|uniref:Uncharacterized protein n=1 Tax=BD1-7 clade bacterium TaxID=2029982 RepID=A0A5S9R0D3_9GAMM|nr:Uncharacterised protein [BD1-7 clade bacterium]
MQRLFYPLLSLINGAVLFFVVAITLSGCKPPSPPEPPQSPKPSFSVDLDSYRQINTGKTQTRLFAVLKNPESLALTYSWQQLQGSDVLPDLTDKSMLTLGALDVGEYRFQVSATSASGQVASDNITIDVSDDDYSHLALPEVEADLQAQLNNRTFNAEQEPALGHPRLYGSDSYWLAEQHAFEALDESCTMSGYASGEGTVINVKAAWDQRTKGGRVCASNVPTDIALHPDAKQYVNNTIDTSRPPYPSVQMPRLRLLHLIRREQACHRAGRTDCQFTQADVEKVGRALITHEMTRLRNAPRAPDFWKPLYADELGFDADFRFIDAWHGANDRTFMVLEAAPAFKFWTLFLDVFWNSDWLSTEDRDLVGFELEQEISSYLLQIENKHWSLDNGNNWTPVVNAAALHWAILYWHEKPEKARKVLKGVIETNWKHRHYYTDDGGYSEGVSYALTTSYPRLQQQNQLMLAAFGQPLHSVKWLTMRQALPEWILSSTAPDGRALDFGDAWPKQGYSSNLLLEMTVMSELLGIGASVPDACVAKAHFGNVYYDLAFEDPWSVPSALAKDWAGITSMCDLSTTSQKVSLFGEYGLATMRQREPGSTEAAAIATDVNLLLKQTEETFIAVNSVKNNVPHKEMDFAGVIWSAFGERLLSDFAYGEIVRNYFEYDVFERQSNNQYKSHFDHMLGANTLVVPGAFIEYHDDVIAKQRYEYRGQIYGKQGHITQQKLNGVDVLHVNGDDVYGGTNDPKFSRVSATGQLDRFDRWLVPAVDGDYVIIDSFRVKPGNESKVQEFWYTRSDTKTDCVSNRELHSTDVVVSKASDNVMNLNPRCHYLRREVPAEVSATMTGAALNAGKFVTDIPTFFPSDSEFQTDALSMRDGIAQVSMTNVLRKRESRSLFRWVPDNAVSDDVRLFYLHAATPTNGGLQPITIVPNGSCGADTVCFEVTKGTQTTRYTLKQADGHYQMEVIESL